MSAVAAENKDQVGGLPSAEEQLETIAPTAAQRTIVLRDGELTHTFTQKPLSFFGKLEFFSVMGRALDKAMSGTDGLSLAQLFEVPARAEDGSILPSDISEADVFVRGISKVAEQAPELMGEIFCVALDVPRGNREYITELMGQSEEDGGLSDNDGFGILETFISQNWEVLMTFFRERIPALVGQVRAQTPKEEEKPKRKKDKATTSRSSKQ